MITQNSPRLRLNPMKDPMVIKQLSATSPESDDSTMPIRHHLRTQDHMIMKQLSATSPESDDLTIQIRHHLRTKDHMIMKNSPRLHLNPMTQPCTYDITLQRRTIYDITLQL